MTTAPQKPERILIVGSGAREHAIATALDRSPQHPLLFCFGSSRNPGIAEFCAGYRVGDICEAHSVAAWAVAQAATLAVIGPEAPLAAGVADALSAAGIAVVGPAQSLARIESSKGFARALLEKYGIDGNPKFQRFTPDMLADADAFLHTLPSRHVVKDDGLAGGKGVKVFGEHLQSHGESLAFCAELAAAGHAFVIEEKLDGEEFSLLSFTDGATLRHMPAVQDHKRAFAGDTGPNTGGMGSYTCADGSLPFLGAEDIAAAHRINEQVVAALRAACGAPYRGVLYGGFMATTTGVRLIEYNARFGDPECLNLLALLRTDFVSVCRALAGGTLHELAVAFEPQASVCKYLVPEGYPENPCKGDPVPLPRVAAGSSLFLGAVDVDGDRLVATGSRTLACVSVADTLAQAEAECEGALRALPGRFFHRNDIGTAALIAKRVEHMRALRPETNHA